ncbi:MAG: HAD family phosphatase [Atopobiaceae bacterium]|nr:HAD family phosphatase [Atopobiaceae bacterium]
MPIKAVIFDMDGVLVDSEPAHQERIRQFFADHGLDVPTDQLNMLVGCSGGYFVTRATEWWAQSPCKSKEERTLAVMEAFQLWKDSHEPIDYGPLLNPGVRETLETLAARGIRLAVASSTSHEGIRQELGPSSILPSFEVVVSGEEFRESKPDPEIYLTTMARLGLGPDECIAVEDSNRGIAAALAAGMRVAVKREQRFGFAQEGGTWYLDRIDELLDIVA